MVYLVATAIALALYTASAGLHVRAALVEGDIPTHARWFATVGLVVHGLAIASDMIAGVVPGFAESLSLASFTVMLVTTIVAKDKLASLASFLAPGGALLLGASYLAPSATVAALDDTGGSWWLPVHLGLVFAAMAGFFLEFVASVIAFTVRRRLKTKKLARVGRLPSLDVLDKAQFRAMVFGLACLALGMAAGVFWAASVMHHQSWASDPKLWFSVVLWVWYMSTLQLRNVRGSHGRWSLVMSSVGFVGMLFGFVGLDFVAEGFHAYGG